MRVPYLHPTRGTLPVRPVLQYRKASSQNRLQVGTPLQFRLRAPPPNAVPTAGSVDRLNRSVKSEETLNNVDEITKPDQPIPRLTLPTATARSVHNKPLSTSSSGPSTPASVKLEPVEPPQVWAEAGLVANNKLNLGTDTIFVKREVLEEESVLPAGGWKRLKLEAKELEAEQLLEYKDGSYLVKWVGLSLEQSTWEPAVNLNCAQLVHQFHTSK